MNIQQTQQQTKEQRGIPTFHLTKEFALEDAIAHVKKELCPESKCDATLLSMFSSIMDVLYKRYAVHQTSQPSQMTVRNVHKKHAEAGVRSYPPTVERIGAVKETFDLSTLREPHTYFNYILGYYKPSPTLNQHNGLVMRLAKVDDDNVNINESLRSSYEALDARSMMQYETFLGTKHAQLAAFDVDIVFSGVLAVQTNASTNKKSIIITPMSGSWCKIMDATVKGIANSEEQKDKIPKILNILNVVCTQYVIHLLKQQKDGLQHQIVVPVPSTIKGGIMLRSQPINIPEWLKETDIDYHNCTVSIALNNAKNTTDGKICNKTDGIPQITGLKAVDRQRPVSARPASKKPKT